jgi:hypothetical protein
VAVSEAFAKAASNGELGEFNAAFKAARKVNSTLIISKPGRRQSWAMPGLNT